MECVLGRDVTFQVANLFLKSDTLLLCRKNSERIRALDMQGLVSFSSLDFLYGSYFSVNKTWQDQSTVRNWPNIWLQTRRAPVPRFYCKLYKEADLKIGLGRVWFSAFGKEKEEIQAQIHYLCQWGGANSTLGGGFFILIITTKYPFWHFLLILKTNPETGSDPPRTTNKLL